MSLVLPLKEDLIMVGVVVPPRPPLPDLPVLGPRPRPLPREALFPLDGAAGEVASPDPSTVIILRYEERS